MEHNNTAIVVAKGRPSREETNGNLKSSRRMTSCLKNGSSLAAPRPPSPPTPSTVLGETVVIQSRTSASSTFSANSHLLLHHDDSHNTEDDDDEDYSDHEDEFEAGNDGDTVGSGVDHGMDSDSFTRRIRKKKKTKSKDVDADEAQRILIVRILFSMVLILSAVGIACAVFFFVRATEAREFENQYQSDADKLKEAIGGALRSTLESADSWAINYIAVQKSGNASFPFVSLPSFAIQAAKFKMMARAYAIGVSYIVTDEQKSEWERFAATHGPPFVQEAWELQSQDETFQGSLETYPIIRDELFTNFPEVANVPEGSGPYLVWWQNYPIVYNPISAAYNFHLLSFPTFHKLYNATLSTKRPVLSGFNLADPETDIGKTSIQYLSNFVAKGESSAEPVTNLVYPILSQNLLDLRLDEETVDSSELVGTIAVGLFWRELLRDILPETSEGIHVVTEEICLTKEAAIFTYEINGSTTTFLGLGDWSEPAYRHLESSFAMVELTDTKLLSSGHRYTGIPMIETDCSIRVKIYPSSKFESSSYKSKSVALTISTVVVFLFAGILFGLYDLLVKRRQRKVAEVAARSSAIVSDLFPKEVQTRLYEAQDGSTKDKSRKSKHITWAASASPQDRGSISLDSDGSDERNADPSIADVYPCKYRCKSIAMPFAACDSIVSLFCSCDRDVCEYLWFRPLERVPRS